MAEQEINVPLNESYVNRSPLPVREGAHNVDGCWSDPAGLLQPAPTTTSSPNPGGVSLALATVEGSVHRQRFFPDAHTIRRFTGETPAVDARGVHQQAAWPTHVTGVATVPGAEFTDRAAIDLDDLASVFYASRPVPALNPNHAAPGPSGVTFTLRRSAEGTEVRAFDSEAREAAAAFVQPRAFDVGLATYEYDYPLALVGNGTQVWYFGARSLGASHPDLAAAGRLRTYARAVSVVDGVVTLGARVYLLSGAEPNPDLAIAVFPSAQDIAVFYAPSGAGLSMVTRCVRLGWPTLAALFPAGVITPPGAYSIPVDHHRLSTTRRALVWLHDLSGTGNGPWETRIQMMGTQTNTGFSDGYVSLDLTDLEAKQPAAYSAIRYTYTVSSYDWVGSVSFGVATPRLVVAYRGRAVPVGGVDGQGHDWAALSVLSASGPGTVPTLQPTHTAMWHKGFVPAALQALDVGGERALLVQVRRADTLDPSEDLCVLRGNAQDYLSWGHLARYSVDVAYNGPSFEAVDSLFALWGPQAFYTSRPRSAVTTTRAGILSYERRAYDAPGFSGYSLVALDLQPGVSNTNEPRIVTAASKSYLSGGVLRVFDGDRLLDVASSFSAEHLPAFTGAAVTPVPGRSVYGELRRYDATGDGRRSTIAGPQAHGGVVYQLGAVPSAHWWGTADREKLVFWEQNSGDNRATSTANADASVFVSHTWRFANTLSHVNTRRNDQLIWEPGVPYTTNSATGELSNWAPPAVWDLVAVGDRLVCLDATDRSRYFYTKPKISGVEFEFAAELTGQLPASAGRSVAIQEFDGNVVIIAERGVYIIGGQGRDRVGGGQPFSPPRLLSEEATTSDARLSVVRLGTALFWRAKSGFVTLGQGWQIQREARVNTSTTEVRCVHVPEREEVWVFPRAGEQLVFHYVQNKWSNPQTAVMRSLHQAGAGWRGLTSTDVTLSLSSVLRTDLNYTTRDMAPAGLAGEATFDRVQISGVVVDPLTPGGVDLNVNIQPDYRSGQSRSVPLAAQRLGEIWAGTARLGFKARAMRLQLNMTCAARACPAVLKVVVASDGTMRNVGPATK